MARVFRDTGIPAAAVWADSPDSERAAALTDVAARRVNALFSGDLFNEGVDIPAVDTLLLLRPTDSPTLSSSNLAEACAALPARRSARSWISLVSTARNFGSTDGSDRCLAEVGGSSRTRLPLASRFCRRAATWNLTALPPTSCWKTFAQPCRRAGPRRSQSSGRSAKGDPAITLGRFLDEAGPELDDVYTGRKTFSDLRADAGLSVLHQGPEEDVLRVACGRLLHIDDHARIDAYRKLLADSQMPNIDVMSVRERALTRMLLASVTDRALEN